jgi:exportin-2 (importin alpha re-exporter)
MRPFSQTIFMLLLNRLNSKPSTHFTLAFVYFAMLLCALDSVGPDFLIQTLDGIQPG